METGWTCSVIGEGEVLEVGSRTHRSLKLYTFHSTAYRVHLWFQWTTLNVALICFQSVSKQERFVNVNPLNPYLSYKRDDNGGN